MIHVCIYIHMYINVYVNIQYFPNSTTQNTKTSKGKKDNYTVKTSFLEEKNFYAERLFMKLMYESSLSWT